MNPYFDATIIKKATFSKWNWIWLWVFPTYVNIGLEEVTYYKKVCGCIYLLKIELPPWHRIQSDPALTPEKEAI